MDDVILPSNWRKLPLIGVAKIVRGVSYRKEHSSEHFKDGHIPILRATNIQEEKLILDSELVYVPQNYVKSDQLLKKEDIVVCMSSGSKHLVGKTAQLRQHWDGSFGTFCAVIRPSSNINKLFLGYYLTSPDYRDLIRRKSAGININNLKPIDLQTIFIPFPPPPEQERIVARIEELFTQLDAGVAGLRRARAGLKRYRAAVLKAACEGRLGDGASGEEEEMPEGWRWMTIDDACERIVDCLHSTPKFTEDGHYCVDSTWIKPGIFVLKRARFVDEVTFLERNRRMRPQENDVVFSREGALLGVAVRVPANFDFCLGQRMMIFRSQVFVHSQYLEFFLNSQIFRSQYAPLITGTASPHLNITDIKNFQVPVPPLSEQRRIVAEVEQRLSVAREVETAVEAGLARAGRLRQAVLKAAFEGRLG